MRKHFLAMTFLSLLVISLGGQTSPFDGFPRQEQESCGVHVHPLGQDRDQWDPEGQPNYGVETDSILIVPVVVHVRHNHDYANVSSEVVQEMIREMNRRFALENSDTSQIHPEFRKRMGNPRIEFRLARLDPDGQPTSGITRSTTSSSCIPPPSGTSWNKYKYLNIVISYSGSGSSYGEASFPDTDLFMGNGSGIVLSSRNFFRFGNYAIYLGHTNPTHEAGHYLGLNHTWAATNDTEPASGCNKDDNDGVNQVFDTPNQLKATTAYPEYTVSKGKCPTYPHISCPNEPTGDNFNNYMDYSCCTSMFTKDQAKRMRSILTTYRSELSSESNLLATGTDDVTQSLPLELPPRASFAYDNDRDSAWVILTDPIHFRGLYDNTKPETWEWTFTGGTPATSSDRNPLVTFPTTGKYPVQLIVTNAFGADTLQENLDIFVLPKNDHYQDSLVEDFEQSVIGEDIFEWAWTIKSGWVQDVLDGNQVARRKLDLTSYFCPTGGMDYLHLPPMSLKGKKQLELSFKAAFAKDYPTGVHGTFWVYGGTSANLREHEQLLKLVDDEMLTTNSDFPLDKPVSTSDWKSFSIQIPEEFDDAENFYLSFILDNTDGSSFYLDDIRVKENMMTSAGNPSQADDFRIYPNPVTDVLYVEAGRMSDSQYVISNTFGQPVKQGVLNHKLDISQLPGGVFHLLISDAQEGRIRVFRFVRLD